MAAFVGNQQFNRPSDRSDVFHTLEFTLNRRSVGRWGGGTVFTSPRALQFGVAYEF